MMTREEVINGLQEVIDYEIIVYLYRTEAIECAIEMLKAQEPRVLTLDEYKAIAESKKDERVPVWEEWRYTKGGWKIPEKAYCGYGEDWRAWTDRPTEEQREATPWG